MSKNTADLWLAFHEIVTEQKASVFEPRQEKTDLSAVFNSSDALFPCWQAVIERLWIC